MITVFAAVSAAALGFVAGCLWENGRADGSYDKTDQVLEALADSRGLDGDQLGQLSREAGGQIDGTDCQQIEHEEKARE